MNSQYIIVYNKVTCDSEKYGLPRSFLTKQEEWDNRYSSSTHETDSDTGGTLDHAVSGRKSVINWPAPTSLLNERATACHCYWLAEHICEQRQGSYWRGQRIKNLSADLAASVCLVSEQRQRPNCHYWRASPASLGTRTKTRKGFTS